MSKQYGVLPSALMHIDDHYTSFCLDEACSYIRQRLEKGDKIVQRNHYTSFKQMYADLEEVED